MIRLIEVLLHGGPHLNGWRTTQIWQAIHTAFALSPEAYSLNQLRYDLGKLKGHGLLERVGKQYTYRLTDKGTRVAAMFVLFHKRVCGPLANSLFHHRPTPPAPSPLLKSKPLTTKPMLPFKNLIDQLAA